MKKKRIPSAIPIYIAAFVWIVIGVLAPKWLLSAGTFALTALISAAGYFGGSFLFKGKEIDVPLQADSGDEEVNRAIDESRARLRSLQIANSKLPDPEITEKLDRMVKTGNSILDLLEKNTGKAHEVRRFMNYYLPVTEKVMAEYVVLSNAPSKGENIEKAMRSVENSLGMIADAFDRQLDGLYEDKSFDIEADMTVLETILKAEGLAAAGSIAQQLHTAEENKNEEKGQVQAGA